MSDINTINALIQHRRGLRQDLPQPLEPGEIGLCTDTGQVFIGTSSEEAVATPVIKLYGEYVGANSSPNMTYASEKSYKDRVDALVKCCRQIELAQPYTFNEAGQLVDPGGSVLLGSYVPNVDFFPSVVNGAVTRIFVSVFSPVAGTVGTEYKINTEMNELAELRLNAFEGEDPRTRTELEYVTGDASALVKLINFLEEDIVDAAYDFTRVDMADFDYSSYSSVDTTDPLDIDGDSELNEPDGTIQPAELKAYLRGRGISSGIVTVGQNIELLTSVSNSYETSLPVISRTLEKSDTGTWQNTGFEYDLDTSTFFTIYYSLIDLNSQEYTRSGKFKINTLPIRDVNGVIVDVEGSLSDDYSEIVVNDGTSSFNISFEVDVKGVGTNSLGTAYIRYKYVYTGPLTGDTTNLKLSTNTRKWKSF